MKRSSRIALSVILPLALMVGVGGYFTVKAIVDSGITKGPDAMFGDQHLKTAVALIELHKVRNGRYPEDLRKLKFTGQWDLIALGSVRYVTSSDGQSYYVEVERGWIGKPKLEMPDEFWRGTGYDPTLAGSE